MRRTPHAEHGAFEQARERELRLIRALGLRLVDGQFLSHRSAAMLWGAPLQAGLQPELHATAFEPKRAPKIQGVHGHRSELHRAQTREVDGVRVASPATVFATSGGLPLTDLVALGDFLVRIHREGYGRRGVGKPPLATVEELKAVVALGRWRGNPRLLQALALIREDAWSPRESTTRVHLVAGGLPEPDLNVDVFDEHGNFLGCLDMVYRRFKVAVEYQGQQHAERYAEDVERYEALAAAGWKTIQVTNTLLARPSTMVARVEEALRERGWDGAA